MKYNIYAFCLTLFFIFFGHPVWAQQFSNEGMVYKVLSEEESTVVLHKAHRCVQHFTVPYEVMDYQEHSYRVTEIEYDAFRNLDCLYKLDLSGVLVIREGYARRYEDGAMDYFGSFANCRNLQSVSFRGVRVLGDYAFYGCKLLKEVYLENVEQVGTGAFLDCKGLEQVSLGEKVEQVMDDAFGRLDKLKRVETEAVVPPVCAENAFSQQTYEKVPLFVPAGTASAYRQAAGWNQFVSIEEMPLSAIAEMVSGASVQISVRDGAVVLTSVLQGDVVRVYDEAGHLVMQKAPQGNFLRLALEKNCVYWIKVGSRKAVGVRL